MTQEMEPVGAARAQSLIFIRSHMQRFYDSLLAEARTASSREERQLAEFRDGLRIAEQVGDEIQARRYRIRITRRHRETEKAGKILAALEAGFVPMPRLPALSLRFLLGLIPPDALLALDEAKKTGLFEEFRVVNGQDADSSGWPRQPPDRKSGNAPRVDPVLVGMIAGEMFPVAWWR